MKQAKSISMSIRVNEEELNKLKIAAELSSYASYSEFVRRTSLVEANKVIARNLTSSNKKYEE